MAWERPVLSSPYVLGNEIAFDFEKIEGGRDIEVVDLRMAGCFDFISRVYREVGETVLLPATVNL